MSHTQTANYIESVRDSFIHALEMRDFDTMHTILTNADKAMDSILRFEMSEEEEREYDEYARKVDADCPHNHGE